METWQDQAKHAVLAGEREFGPLDAHQTARNNLVHRCEEIMAEEASGVVSNSLPGALAMSDSDGTR